MFPSKALGMSRRSRERVVNKRNCYLIFRTFGHRLNEQEQITKFLEKTVGDKKRVQFDKYMAINKEISSEMVLSLM